MNMLYFGTFSIMSYDGLEANSSSFVFSFLILPILLAITLSFFDYLLHATTALFHSTKYHRSTASSSPSSSRRGENDNNHRTTSPRKEDKYQQEGSLFECDV